MVEQSDFLFPPPKHTCCPLRRWLCKMPSKCYWPHLRAQCSVVHRLLANLRYQVSPALSP